MSIILFEHNRITYENILKMFDTGLRVGVVQPTGTGKSFLFLKWIEDNPQDKFIILSPSTEIFSQLKDYVMEAGNNQLLINCQMITYQTLLRKSEGELADIKADKIIIDEFHRVGADLWGTAVNKILKANPLSQVLGATATPVRYLDSGKDMAEELFENNLACYMTLGEAVARNILPKPVYVPVWYDMSGKLDKYKADINKITDHFRREILEEKLKDLRARLINSYGASEIFEKYISPQGKYIVFCSDYEHLLEMQDKMEIWLNGVNANIKNYVSISRDYLRDRQLEAFRQDNDESAIKLLFTIDRLNEGVHVKGIDGVVMLRPTISPIIYLQQMGRALASGSKAPVIFDMVNNYQNVQVYSPQSEYINIFVNEYNRELYRNSIEETDDRAYRLFEQVTEFNSLFAQLESTLYISNESRWRHTFETVKEYIEISGKSPVPGTIYNNINIGEWVAEQNRNYRNGTLLQEREDKLRAIGVVLGDKAEIRWQQYFDLLKEYIDETGTVPGDRLEYKGANLGKWLVNQKNTFNKGRMSEKRIKMFETIGVQFTDTRQEKWLATYQLVCDYVAEFNYLPEKSTVYQNANIGSWLNSQITKAKNGKLAEDRKDKLLQIGVAFETAYDRQWMHNYNTVKECITEFGGLPRSLQEYNGVNIARWLKYQKQLKNAGKMSEERIDLLKNIGIVFDIH